MSFLTWNNQTDAEASLDAVNDVYGCPYEAETGYYRMDQWDFVVKSRVSDAYGFFKPEERLGMKMDDLMSDLMPGFTENIDKPDEFYPKNDYQVRESDLDGNVDGKKYLVSVFVWLDRVEPVSDQVIFSLGSGNLTLFWDRVHKIFTLTGYSVNLETGTHPGLLRVLQTTTHSATPIEADGQRHHLLFSGDLAVPGSGQVYLNDVEATNIVTFDDAVLDYTNPDHAIGANKDGTDQLYGSLSKVYVNLTENLDLSIEENRRLFVSADLEPVYLGNNGELPTGNASIIYAPTGDATTNLGTGGNFTTIDFLA